MQTNGANPPLPERGMPAYSTVDILGFPVANVDMEEALAAVIALQERRRALSSAAGAAGSFVSGGGARVVTANAEILYHSLHSRELGALLKSADFIVPDGFGVVKAASMLGRPVKAKVAGVDLMGELAAWAALSGRSIYLLGASKESVGGTAALLRKKYPALQIAGWHDGYFHTESEEKILLEIQEKKPDFLFVALGFPGQELFMAKHKARLCAAVGVMMGVGGAFDAISGRVKRAPGWVQRANLEWVYRFAQNPRRLGRFKALPGFMQEVRRQKRREDETRPGD